MGRRYHNRTHGAKKDLTMKYLFSHLDGLKKELKARYVILFLDYDGTLSPIVETPAEALISKEMKGLIKNLSEAHQVKLVIISGRSLGDIKKLVGLKEILYVGNHGLEIEGPKIKFRMPVSARFKTALKKIKKELHKKLGKIRGVFIEDKALTLTVHYRLADEKDKLVIKNLFYETVRPYRLNKEVSLKYGKKVFEIRPPVEWDKGKAALWLLARQRFVRGEGVLPIYIGDDLTDEDAFKALKKRGITVFVGEPKFSNAEYYLKDTKEVFSFLKYLLTL